MNKKRKWVAGAVALTVGSSLGGIALWNSPTVPQYSYAAEKVELPSREQLSHADALSDAFNSVAEMLKPSVVTITSVRHVQQQQPQLERRRSSPQLPQGIPDEFRRFFNDDLFDRFGQIPNMPNPNSPFEQQGMGSGVIVSADGYVLTNNHVVRDADEVNVMLSDDHQIRAKIVGVDEKTDLAVLKIDVKGLVPAKLGNSDQSKVGQWVLAIGSPFELDQTVTAGIISAKSRVTGIIREGYEDFLQTDAAINPGNSGGPLVNLRGEVIGINTAIFSRGGAGNVGVGFAIPSNMAKNVMDSIITKGKVVRGYLGAAIQPLDEGLAQSFKFQGTRGVLIGNVMDNSPAAKAGLREGDIVTEIDGRPVHTISQLRNTVAALAPNSKATLVVYRDGKKQNVQATVGELPTEATASVEPSTPEATRQLGLRVAAITPEIAEQIGYKGDMKGVVVAAVAPGSLAERASLRPKDVILSIGSTRINEMSDYRDAVTHLDLKAGVRMQVLRDGVKRFVVVRDSD